MLGETQNGSRAKITEREEKREEKTEKYLYFLLLIIVCMKSR